MLLGKVRRASVIGEDPDEFREVELRLLPGPGDSTTAELRVNPGQAYPATTVRLEPAALAPLASQRYGELLGRQLFEGTELRRQYDEIRAGFDASQMRWRLRLRLDDPVLQEIRWECLCHPVAGGWTPIAAGGAIPFSRFVYVHVDSPKGRRPLTERPIHVLYVAASGTGLARGPAPITVAERAAMRRAIATPGGSQVEVDELTTDGTARPTLAALRAAMTREPAIVQFLCHGFRGPDGTALLLEGDGGHPVVVPAEDVLDALRAAATLPRLVVLTACESAAMHGTRAFVALGPALAIAGVEAVVAMSAPIGIATAEAFCGAFYERLFTHGVVDRAVNEARAAVRGAWDWSVPVLFSRSADQQLLDFPAGRVHAEYLDLSDRLVRSVASARTWGAQHDVDAAVIDAMSSLIEELEKSHEVLTKLAAGFRRTARDPSLFSQAFRDFRNEFKEYYDQQSWHRERTRCHEVGMRAAEADNVLRAALSPEEFSQFEEDVRNLSNADNDIIRYLGEFLERMDKEVDAIAALLARNDTDAALRAHQAFDLEISPSFRKSKALLAEIGERANRVSAA